MGAAAVAAAAAAAAAAVAVAAANISDGGREEMGGKTRAYPPPFC